MRSRDSTLLLAAQSQPKPLNKAFFKHRGQFKADSGSFAKLNRAARNSRGFFLKAPIPGFGYRSVVVGDDVDYEARASWTRDTLLPGLLPFQTQSGDELAVVAKLSIRRLVCIAEVIL